MKTYYVYKITFEEVPHFYFGMRKHSNPLEDTYMGTPYTHQVYWRIYTPKKQIFKICKDQESACKLEKSLILQNWTSKYCLNENAAGAVSENFCRLGAIKANQTIKAKRQLDPNYDLLFKQRCIKTNQTIQIKRKLSSDYNKKFLEMCKKSLAIARQKALSEESKLKRIETFKLINHQQGTKNSMYGTMWITDGTKESSYRISKTAPVPPGYRKGRVCK